MIESYPICIKHNIPMQKLDMSRDRYYDSDDKYYHNWYYCSECQSGVSVEYLICPVCMSPMYVHCSNRFITFCSNKNCSLYQIREYKDTVKNTMFISWGDLIIYYGGKIYFENFYTIELKHNIEVHQEIENFIISILSAYNIYISQISNRILI